MERINEDNRAVVCGVFRQTFAYSHRIYGEVFYKAEIRVSRKSGAVDDIPVMVPGRLCDPSYDYTGKLAGIAGEFRSFNERQGDRNRLCLYLFAKEIIIPDEDDRCKDVADCNRILLHGYLCKEPVYRETPLGREITELLIAVNRAYGKSDYIPCICWGRNARYASGLGTGDRILLEGRIQSREYIKIDEKGKSQKTAYEVSVQKISCLQESCSCRCAG